MAIWTRDLVRHPRVAYDPSTAAPGHKFSTRPESASTTCSAGPKTGTLQTGRLGGDACKSHLPRRVTVKIVDAYVSLEVLPVLLCIL